jgi:hypothetical protein
MTRFCSCVGESGEGFGQTCQQAEVRAHSRAARTRVAFETQKIRRDNFVLQPNSVEAAEQTGYGISMTLCLLLVSAFCGSRIKNEPLTITISRSTAGTSSSLIITCVEYNVYSRLARAVEHTTPYITLTPHPYDLLLLLVVTALRPFRDDHGLSYRGSRDPRHCSPSAGGKNVSGFWNRDSEAV